MYQAIQPIQVDQMRSGDQGTYFVFFLTRSSKETADCHFDIDAYCRFAARHRGLPTDESTIEAIRRLDHVTKVQITTLFDFGGVNRQLITFGKKTIHFEIEAHPVPDCTENPFLVPERFLRVTLSVFR